MFKSSPGYELGWYLIKHSEKPFELHRNCSHDQHSSYPGEHFKFLCIYVLSRFDFSKAFDKIGVQFVEINNNNA